MKKLFKYIAVLAASVMAFGCYPEVLTPDAGQIPSASDFDVEITVDNETNYVTFTMKNEGVVPMWIFGDQNVDKTPNTRFAYTQNGITLRFREAGEHKVEVKAYNAHGVSQGSQIYTFTLDNTYRDPFDPTPYMKAIAGEWQFNQGVKGHFGCGSINPDTGQATTDGTDWWSCDPDGKEGMGLYDDRVTFTAEGAYTYDPGDAGTVYVNWGMAANGYHADCYNGDEQDYQAPIEGYTTTYTVENDWNAAGIEDIYLVLPTGKNLTYIPHKTALDSPRFRFLETAPAKIRKTLSLVNEEPAENNGGGIAWKYEFIPAVHVASPEELLAGTSAEGKVWVMDSAAQGHLGCGESVDNPAGWWSAAADEKKDFGMYDDEITFYPDGKYVYSSGADGLMYINWGVTAIGPNPGAEPDIDIEWPLTESTYEFDGETISLAPNTPMVYVPSDLVWNEPVFHVMELTETTLRVVAENPGCYWQMIFKARDVKAPEQIIAGEPVESGKVTVSLAQGQSIEVSGMDLSTMWTDPDYFTYVDATHLTFNAVDGDYEIYYKESWLKVIPLNADGAWATYDDSKALWIIGDNAGKPTDATLIGWTPENALPMARISENTYRITLAVKTTGGSFKIFGQAAWGREFTDANHTTTDLGLFHITNGTDGGDPGNIYANKDVADGYYTMTVTDADGTLTAKIEEYVEAEKPGPLDPASDANMWKNAVTTNVEFFFADNSWAQVSNPGFTAGDNEYVVVIPEGTGATDWQGQVRFHNTGLVCTPDKTYDFQVTLNSTADHNNGVIVKGCWQDPAETDNTKWDKNDLFYKGDINLVAYEDYVYTVHGVQGTDIPDFKLVFDFAGAEAGSEITISGITLIEH